jgi:alginate O-acetyltransferase complex protein AlgJ
VASESPLPSGGHLRELAALAEIEHTQVSRPSVGILMGCFLVAITIVPLAEIAIARHRAGASMVVAWSHMAEIPGKTHAALAGSESRGVWRRIVTANHVVLDGLSGFERALENETFIGRTLRPPAQSLMTGALGAGNERVYVGRDRWVFYREDVEYVSSPGFLESAQMRRRTHEVPAWIDLPEPDPRPAILQLKRDLDARHITLIVMPTPVKPGVHPERLGDVDGSGSDVLHNPSFEAFVRELLQTGVLVFDPSALLAGARPMGPQYLATDTHWRPEAMESVAAALADFVTVHGGLASVSDPDYRIERIEQTHLGDTARMLDLPHDSRLFDPETVWLRRVLNQDGSLWRSSRDADVLLLGDSFANMYSLESMGWGISAGLVEQLSFGLGRPVDRLVQNDQGSFATRAMLQQDASRLEGKRVVIYQFAVRELTEGDWKVLPLPPPAS